jgi:hemoglobin
MRQTTRWSVLLSACLAVVVGTSAAPAADDKPAAGALDRKTLDGLLYTNLKEIANHGATLYNTGDWNGCYRLYEGALMAVRPLLEHHPKLQDAIKEGIANAQQAPRLERRAFVLREVLDKVRSDLKGNAPAKKDKEAATGVEASKTLWNRLGGEEGVTRIVDDMVNTAAPDPKVDFFRHGKYKMSAEEVAKMKREIVEQVSEAAGGPLKYTGPDMKKVHKGMGITDEQFDALAGHLKKALEKNRVAPADADAVLATVNSYRKEIVEPKKSGEKTTEEKEGKKQAAASVMGTVTFKGKPADGAKISFVPAEGKAVSDTVGKDGSYRLSVTPGVYTITISGGPNLALPAQYADADKSGVKVNVKEGRQTHDIALQ